ncbi:MAG: ABC transporter substrate-binding protein [Desulfovibrio sp.]|jgi:ABC-type nitrate/sulfonate/bicarbonate transport system substrate-binding protein|nr:ABC transporter substrate-binding protein [Desulfovibrio sp.]
MSDSWRILDPSRRGGKTGLASVLAALIIVLTGNSVFAAPPSALTSINLQASAWTVIAQQKGIFKEEFDKIGVREVKLIAAGAAELLGAETAAVAGGAIAVAQRMIYPATVHRANGLDNVLIWVSEPSNHYRTPVLAKASNDALKSVADLDGKKLGSARASCYWAAPFEILDKAGLPLDTRNRKGRVRYETIDNPTVMISSLLSGATDATAAHLAANQFTGAWLSGQFKIIGSPPDDGVYVNHSGRVTYLANRGFVEKYPEVIKAFLIAHERTRSWATDHTNEAAEIIAKELREPVEAALFQITHLGQWDFMGGEPDAEKAVNSIKAFQTWYVEHGDDILGDRKLTDEQINAFVAKQFFSGGKYSIYQ